jgi:hypothetical protein
LSNANSTLYSTVAALNIDRGSQATTTAAGYVAEFVQIDGGSKLTLGADMTLSGSLQLSGTGSILDMAGHALNANYAYLYAFAGVPTFLNRGPMTIKNLEINNQTFDLNAADAVRNLTLNNAHATTTSAGNVTDNVWMQGTIDAPSVLTLGAAMTLSIGIRFSDGNFWLNDYSTLDMAGHSLTAHGLSLYGGNVINHGQIVVDSINMYGSTLTLHPGDLIDDYIDVSTDSALTVSQANGQLTGLTFNGAHEINLGLVNTNMNFGQTPFSHWIFRWRNPDSANNWIGTLTSEIGAGRISVNPSSGYSIADRGGYTYIYVPSHPADFDWQGGNATGPTNWGLAANWSANTVEPNGTGVIVSFGNQSPANPIVDIISGDKTVGGIVFLSTTSTTLQSTGGYDLMLDNNGDISTIDVSGDHQVTAPVIMNNDVQVIGSGTLALPGGISGSHTLIVTGNLIASSIQVDSLRIEGGGMAVADIGGDGSSLAAVPEPRALVLLGVFAVGLSCAAWRRRTSKIAEICHSIR